MDRKGGGEEEKGKGGGWCKIITPAIPKAKPEEYEA